MSRTRAAVVAGLVAGVVATIAELALWWLFSDRGLQLLYRDARFAAAIVLGNGVLPPPATFDATVMLAAMLVHFTLSVLYAVALSALIRRSDTGASIFVGCVFGLALYVANMYGFTAIFPWFVADRDGITVAAHIAFGASAAVAYRWLAAEALR